MSSGIALSSAIPRSVCLAAFLQILPGVHVAQSPVHLGLSAGVELHSNWPSSDIGPSVAFSIARPLGARLQLGGNLALSGRGINKDDEVTFEPSDDIIVVPADPTLALAAGVDLFLYDHPGAQGGYVLASVGLIHYAGNQSSETRPLLTAGIGGVVTVGSGQLFAEFRVARTLGCRPGSPLVGAPAPWVAIHHLAPSWGA